MNIKVEVFSSPGCSKCSHAKSVLQKLVEEIGGDAIQWREVNILDELDYAVQLGVLSTPAIAIDDELVFVTLPSANKLRAELEGRLNAGTRVVNAWVCCY
ncbi:MAG: thioredoxin family protein [Gammaproteobacteria bacterium]|nr:thioredoxin family protein [Gammaproteobacteria bacterium]MCF6261399.1 thioredoxin family protein [Gammaproteobacteria bacterium]